MGYSYIYDFDIIKHKRHHVKFHEFDEEIFLNFQGSAYAYTLALVVALYVSVPSLIGLIYYAYWIQTVDPFILHYNMFAKHHPAQIGQEISARMQVRILVAENVLMDVTASHIGKVWVLELGALPDTCGGFLFCMYFFNVKLSPN